MACAATASASGADDTLYLCNFRVSVDGDWLCLKEVADKVEDGCVQLGLDAASADSAGKAGAAEDTPEFEQLINYPDYPLGRGGDVNLFTPLKN